MYSDSSGVQRLLDARGQSGSWMLSKILCIPLVKFLTTFFSRSPKFFTFFASVINFHENSFLGCPPVLHHAPVTTFFYFFFSHLPTFLRKLVPWMPPRVDAGAVAPSAPPSAHHCLTEGETDNTPPGQNLPDSLAKSPGQKPCKQLIENLAFLCFPGPKDIVYFTLYFVQGAFVRFFVL